MSENTSVWVVKVGGTEGVDFEAVCADVAAHVRAGQRLALVHGGSEQATALGEALGHPPRMVTSPSGYTSRYTDRQTLDIFTMAVNGRLNTGLVARLQALGVNALGLSGVDGGLIRARRKATIRVVENGKRKVLHGDYTGRITAVSSALLALLLEAGYTPLIAPLGLSPEGEILNLDADRVAAAVAAALGAAGLLLLTAAPGLLREYPHEETLIAELRPPQLEGALGFAQGRMKKKVLGAREALQGGVGTVIIADGRLDEPIARALAGGGTWIKEA